MPQACRRVRSSRPGDTRRLEASGVRCPPDAGATRDRVRALLAGPGAPSAVFAAGAVLTEGAWRAVSDLGLRVPQEVSLAAYGDAYYEGLQEFRIAEADGICRVMSLAAK